MLILSIVGVALVAFGALLLLKFPDRPGGKVALGKVEVSSTGAGLPLIVVGVVCLALGVRGAGGTGDNVNTANSNDSKPPASPTATTTATPTQAASATPDPDPERGFFRAECSALAGRDRDSSGGGSAPETERAGARLVTNLSVEVGARNRRVWTGGMVPENFRVQLFDERKFIGIIRLRLTEDKINPQFRVRYLFDRDCRPVADFENASRGGDPHVLQNWDVLRFKINGATYEARLGFGPDTGVEVQYFNKL